jgi:hypothetical protein
MRWTLPLLAVAVIVAAVLITRHREAPVSTNRTEAPRPAGIAPVRALDVQSADAGNAVQSPAPSHGEAVKASTTAAEVAAQAAARIAQGQ